MRKDEILDYIHKTFSEFPSYLKGGIVNEDDIEKCHDALKLFSENAWFEIKSEHLYHSEDAIRCITKSAFSYYIAAYLKLFIENYYDADALVDTVSNMLTPPVRNGIPSTVWIEKNLDCLYLEKKAVIAFTFQYLSREYGDQKIENALSIYWGQYLNESFLKHELKENKTDHSSCVQPPSQKRVRPK